MNDLVWLPFIAGPVAGTMFYAAVWAYYRNTNKRHTFEHETVTVARNMKGEDVMSGRTTKTEEKKVRGFNSENHLERVRRI